MDIYILTSSSLTYTILLYNVHVSIFIIIWHRNPFEHQKLTLAMAFANDQGLVVFKVSVSILL